jgi:hypothetical protein
VSSRPPASCHDPVPAESAAAAPALIPPASPLILGFPRPALLLAVALLSVGVGASAYVIAVPFQAAAFGGLTVPTVLAAGVADGFNPCAFALLVLFATYTLTLVNSVTADGSPSDMRRHSSLVAAGIALSRVAGHTTPENQREEGGDRPLSVGRPPVVEAPT